MLSLSLPLSLRRKLAKKGRETSKNKQANLSADIMDVTQEEVQKYMQKYQVKTLIHGHTHRPAIHQMRINGQPATRIVLGDWYDQGSILRVSRSNVELIEQQLG